ncbi:MAG: hypothetical protein GY847_13490 [Proteobacteria bacterium]|nr:hypothetical protein [Pseudomonadota bacterium]
MRILIANGAPRKSGYTRRLLDLFGAGVSGAGGELDIVDLSQVDINSCLGCFSCWDSKHTGKCILDDDMSDLLRRYSESDVVVFATPLYFYSFSARLKIFLERLLPLTKPELKRGSTVGLMQNILRNPERGPKRSVLIAVAGHRDLKGMEGLVSTFNLVSEGLSVKPVGTLLRQESFFLDFPLSKPKTMHKICTAFESAGRELVTLGYVQADTERSASLYLTNDHEMYKHQASVYWQIAEETASAGLDREEFRRAVNEDLRILMPELADCLDQAVAGDLEAVFLFDLKGSQPGPWHLVISKGTCHAFAKTHDNPTVTMNASSETFLDIIFQRVDPRRALAQGNLKVTGEKSLFSRFRRLFPSSSR